MKIITFLNRLTFSIIGIVLFFSIYPQAISLAGNNPVQTLKPEFDTTGMPAKVAFIVDSFARKQKELDPRADSLLQKSRSLGVYQYRNPVP